jgi:peptidyl serine alpha-galactosyltransferase
MSNHGLTQRKGRTSTGEKAVGTPILFHSTAPAPIITLRDVDSKKKKEILRPWTWILLGLFMLGGLIYVDEITHDGLHVKSLKKVNQVSSSSSSSVVVMSDDDDDDDKKKARDSHHQVHTGSLYPSYFDESLKHSDGIRYHLIFSTDCSAFQHWQSYLMFHSAYKVNQPGTVTRIASGCSEEDGKKAMEWHKEHVTDIFGERFILFLTPHFSGVKDKDGNTVGDYKFFNKPFGLKHWLENGIGFQSDGIKLNNEDDIVILIDPDMIMLRPITGDFSNDRDVVIGPRNKKDRKFKVEHGAPFAQKYGLGAQWRTFNLKEITQDENSPAMLVSQQDGGIFYPVGAPYIATVRDMYQIALKWSEFVPRVHAEYPYLLAEMFAFCIAAAHLKLPHMLIDSMMISNTGAGGEGWPMVDAMETEGLCEFAKHPDHSKQAVPSVIHFCQRYTLGPWFFSKRKMATDFFECDSPLMEEPPDNLVEETDFAIPFGGNRKELSPVMAKREGFTVCAIIAALNEASLFYKEHHCDNGNMEKTLNLNPKAAQV